MRLILLLPILDGRATELLLEGGGEVEEGVEPRHVVDVREGYVVRS